MPLARTALAFLVLALAAGSTAAAAPPPSAAATFGWGPVVAGDEFLYTGPPDPNKWSVYNSAGHAGNGVRSPAQWAVNGNYARVTGLPDGTTGGMSAKFARQKYGRWEIRMRTNNRSPQYHPVSILWPDVTSERDWEVDYAEGTKATDRINFYLHFNPSSVSPFQSSASQVIDTRYWHNYAVEWTAEHVIGYIDGVEWFRDETPDHIPDVSMHQTLQLDWFPADGTGSPTLSTMDVAWVRAYAAP